MTVFASWLPFALAVDESKSSTAVTADTLGIAMENVKAELTARKSWAKGIPPVIEARRKGGTLMIGIGTPVPADSTQWKVWWEKTICEASELKKVLMLDGGIFVYAGVEPEFEKAVFFNKESCYKRIQGWSPNESDNGRPMTSTNTEKASYKIESREPTPSSNSAVEEKSSVPASTLKTKVVASPLPLRLSIPIEFNEVTKMVFENIARPDFAMYCNSEDAQLMHDQLRAKRVLEQANKGCLSVLLDTSSSYDTTVKRFSVEKIIEDAIEYQRKTPNRKSGSPRFEMNFHAYSKQDVKGTPTITVIQDVAGETGKGRTRFLYVPDGEKVWTVMLTTGKSEDISAAIWDALINGL